MPTYPQRMRRAAAGQGLRNRRRTLRNITGGIAPGDQPTKPGLPTPVPAPAPVPSPTMSPLARQLANGKLPDRFGGFALGPNGGIRDTTVGMSGAAHAAQYQKLYNAAQQAGVNIQGQSGEGGAYNPNVLYARGGNAPGYVDLRTGGVNPANAGGDAANVGFLNPEVLNRLRTNAGFDPQVAADTAHSQAIGPGATPGEYMNLGQGYVAPPVTPKAPAAPTSPPPPEVATPARAFQNGRDPSKHEAYWADKGWNLNDATGIWTGPKGEKWDSDGAANNPGGKPVKPGGPTNDPNGPQSPGAPGQAPSGETGAGVPGGAPTQLPLDPVYEAQRQQAQAQLDRTLSAIQASGLRLSAEEQLALARLATNQGVDVQALLENMAGRGTLNSSIYGDNRNLLATDHGRQRQDLGISIADALAGLSTQAGDAQSDYESQLLAALGDSANRSLNDPYSAIDAYSTTPKKPRKRTRRRKR